MLMTRPSPESKASREWLWISMKPGQTTSPLASIRSFAARVLEHARRRDPRDAAVLEGDVAVEPGVAGAVDHPAAEDHDVVRTGSYAHGSGRGRLVLVPLG